MSSPPSKAPTLSDRQKKMVNCLQNSRDERSYFAPAFFLLACLGKLVFGFGASLTVKGIVEKDTRTTNIGAGLCIFGFICVLFVAFGFGAAVSRCSRFLGVVLKLISIVGGILIATGYALNQYEVSARQPLWGIQLTFLPLFFGGALLTFSLSFFTSYTELVKGRVPHLPIKKRPIAAICLLALGLGVVFAGWITGEKGQWPMAFNAVVLTFAMAVLYAGVALFVSDHVRREAQESEQVLISETESVDLFSNRRDAGGPEKAV
ncbi:hypothetical protein O181_004782 [Austropuccinia psidii MF-1]|uniref:Uncharacterized protein n=1 Tax=Austropuccinia psidii MF-1 TaxID=1389203 RepID=A0A9Q3BGY1_9BASI|nr:hypothetical protein [Austropuccinia psidii MF-1]